MSVASRSSRRRVVLVAAGIVGGLVAFEVALQAIALAVWLSGSGAAPADPGAARTVLCVGDSFTYGLGASGRDQAYPEQLGRLLAGRGRTDLAVVNGGWPGRTSREVLLELPAQLEQFRPVRVALLVGFNDRWNHPARVEGVAGDSGFRLVWRTGRLLALARAWWRGAGYAAPEPEVGDREPEASPPELAAARQALRESRLDDALGLLEAAHDAAGDSRTLALLVRCLVRMGRVEDAFDRLCENVDLYLRGGEHDDLLGDASGPWSAMVRFGMAEERRDRFRAALLRARETMRDAPAAAQRVLLRALYMTQHGDPRAALRTAVAAAQVDPWGGLLVNHLAGHRDAIPRAVYDEVVAELAVDALQERRLRDLWLRAADAAGFAAVLREHVEGVVGLCRAHGAEVVLLDYPFALPVVDATVDRLAADLRLARVGVQAEFERLAVAEPTVERFSGDSARHCNDAGYGVIARLVMRDIVAHLPE